MNVANKLRIQKYDVLKIIYYWYGGCPKKFKNFLIFSNVK